jgi:hypothetical protein
MRDNCTNFITYEKIMPSSQLSLLSAQIENQKTDHFGKFYMYVSLLNTVTARNKTFAEGLPKYSTGLAFWRTHNLNIGEIPVEFSKEVTLYARQFVNLQPDWSTSLYNIAAAYIRKGNVTDLTYIIDQMLSHLTAIHGVQSHNQDIYNYIHFDAKKGRIAQFIGQISEFNQQLLSIIDNSCNTALSILLVTTGLVVILASVFSLVPSLIGLGLMIGGAYGAFSFYSQIEGQLKQLENQMQQIMKKTGEIPQDESLFGDKNHHAFVSSIFTPLPYTAITVCEQLIIDESNQQKLSTARAQLDTVTNLMASI